MIRFGYDRFNLHGSKLFHYMYNKGYKFQKNFYSLIQFKRKSIMNIYQNIQLHTQALQLIKREKLCNCNSRTVPTFSKLKFNQ